VIREADNFDPGTGSSVPAAEVRGRPPHRVAEVRESARDRHGRQERRALRTQFGERVVGRGGAGPAEASVQPGLPAREDAQLVEIGFRVGLDHPIHQRSQRTAYWAAREAAQGADGHQQQRNADRPRLFRQDLAKRDGPILRSHGPASAPTSRSCADATSLRRLSSIPGTAPSASKASWPPPEGPDESRRWPRGPRAPARAPRPPSRVEGRRPSRSDEAQGGVAIAVATFAPIQRADRRRDRRQGAERFLLGRGGKLETLERAVPRR
jgi:hypothetical protein